MDDFVSQFEELKKRVASLVDLCAEDDSLPGLLSVQDFYFLTEVVKNYEWSYGGD